MSGRNQIVGRSGEDAAASWYESNGYLVVDRNWRSRSGELDLIVVAEGVVAFVEVKCRTTDAYGSGFEAVNYAKQRKVRSLALEWLQASPSWSAELRFDVADVDGDGNVSVLEGCF